MGLEHPVKDVVFEVVNDDGASLPLFGVSENAGSVVCVGVGQGSSGQASESKSLKHS